MLSQRLQLIADMVPDCQVMADIGTDHGYLPIELVTTGKVDHAYAMDINQGPLLKAKENILLHGVEGQVVTQLSDGLENLPEGVDTLVIAGMGGMLIGKILEAQAFKLDKIKWLVLSPHLDEPALRRKIHELGWAIKEEVMVKDKGKYYTVMKCLCQQEAYTTREYQYGKQLMDHMDPVWLDYLGAHMDKLKKIEAGLVSQGTENSQNRMKELRDEMKEIRMVTKHALK